MPERYSAAAGDAAGPLPHRPATRGLLRLVPDTADSPHDPVFTDKTAHGAVTGPTAAGVPVFAGTPEPAVFYAAPPAWTKFPDERIPPTRELFPEAPVQPDDQLSPAGLQQLINVRAAVMNRVVMLNVQHADEAFQRRHQQPIGPYGLALLFWIPPDADGRILRTDRRFYTRERRTTDPVDLLEALTVQVHRGWTARAFDVRDALVNLPDRRWTPAEARQARFFGVALSSLDDTPGSGSWARQIKRADSGEDPATCCLVHCVDGGRMLVSRRGAAGLHATDRAASVRLHSGIYAPFQWRYDHDLNRIPAVHPAARTWHALTELTRMIYWGWAR